MSKFLNSKFSIRLPLLLGIAVASGVFIGANLSSSKPAKDIGVLSQKIREVLTFIERDYVDTVSMEDIADEALLEMINKLDPHSSYIPPKDLTLAQSQLEGNFEGIGIEFNIIKDTIYVVTPISGGPSESVGLQPGDKIVKVNDSTVAGTKITIRDVYDLLRGPKGTKVKVGIQRRSTPDLIDFTITRDKIPSYSVDVAYMVDKKTGYIKVSRFSQTTYDEFKKALTSLKQQGMNQLILDLRGNPGGYMDRATNMADEFLSGNKLLVYTKGKKSNYNSEIRAYRPGDFETGALIILVDEGSASASEIVSGAIQDHDRGLIVGRRTFGKGLVQMPFPLIDKSELRLTISRYYTPSGRSIQKPYEVGHSDDYAQDLMNRYSHGEFFHADSIKLNDSLKYTTANGRTVYGGGGIMPDIFVPRDTTLISGYYTDLLISNVMREYALEYYNENKKRLDKMNREAFIQTFEVTEDMLKDIRNKATEAKIDFVQADYNRSLPLIKNVTKAFIGKISHKNEAFYPILNQQDEIFAQALKLFDKAIKIEKGQF